MIGHGEAPTESRHIVMLTDCQWQSGNERARSTGKQPRVRRRGFRGRRKCLVPSVDPASGALPALANHYKRRYKGLLKAPKNINVFKQVLWYGGSPAVRTSLVENASVASRIRHSAVSRRPAATRGRSDDLPEPSPRPRTGAGSPGRARRGAAGHAPQRKNLVDI